MIDNRGHDLTEEASWGAKVGGRFVKVAWCDRCQRPREIRVDWSISPEVEFAGRSGPTERERYEMAMDHLKDSAAEGEDAAFLEES